jgi:L-histidine N-alpha-methyltransferase
LLLDAFSRTGTLRGYVPQDVSALALRRAMNALASEYPGLELHGVVGDFTSDLDRLPGGGRRMVAFLGGTIGNLCPHERRMFLDRLRDALTPGEQLLPGTGLVTDESTLVAAYDDAAGVTAEFNRNVLHVINRELRADFDASAFAHVALWNPVDEWIEMRLRAVRAMTVRVPEAAVVVEFTEGRRYSRRSLRSSLSRRFGRCCRPVRSPRCRPGSTLRSGSRSPSPPRWTVTSSRAAEQPVVSRDRVALGEGGVPFGDGAPYPVRGHLPPKLPRTG